MGSPWASGPIDGAPHGTSDREGKVAGTGYRNNLGGGGIWCRLAVVGILRPVRILGDGELLRGREVAHSRVWRRRGRGPRGIGGGSRSDRDEGRRSSYPYPTFRCGICTRTNVRWVSGPLSQPPMLPPQTYGPGDSIL